MKYDEPYNTPVSEPEEFHDSVESVIKMPADQTWAFENGVAVGKEMVENEKHKEQIKAINGVTKELHELNKTLKLISGRIKA